MLKVYASSSVSTGRVSQAGQARVRFQMKGDTLVLHTVLGIALTSQSHTNKFLEETMSSKSKVD
jgi:hypothetical protein